MIQKTEAIVLRCREFRETSLILTLFTKDFGKIQGLAKGIRVAQPKWGANFSLFSYNAIVFYEKKNLHLITEAELLNSFADNFSTLEENLVANYLTELIDLITPLEDKNSEILQLILNTLSLLREESDLERLVHIFEIKLLKISGFMPRIESCLSCKKNIIKLAYFSHRLGGLLCRECLSHDKRALFINHGTILTLTHILNVSDESMLSRLKMSTPIKNNLGFILREFLAYHLDAFPRSYAFMQKALAKN